MILNTQGLVLHTVPYSESSVVAKIFTRHLGERSYLIKGVRQGKSRNKQNLLQPMSYIDMTVYENHRNQLQHIKEMRPALHWQNNSIVNLSLKFFMDEVLYKSLHEEEPNPQLFDYLVGQLKSIDSDDNMASTHPLTFLLTLAEHLGIAPLDNYSPATPLFDLKEGHYQQLPSAESTTLDSLDSYHLHLYCQAVREQKPSPTLSLDCRTRLINKMLDYYSLHLADFHSFKSHHILHQVLQ